MIENRHESELEGLSDRQEQCLALASRGLTSKEIAREIGISPSTVDTHLRVAAAKLNVPNRRAAVRQLLTSRGARANSQGSPGASAMGDQRKTGFLPPVGGVTNRLSATKRLGMVVRIALVSTMALAAIITTISGIVAILSG